MKFFIPSHSSLKENPKKFLNQFFPRFSFLCFLKIVIFAKRFTKQIFFNKNYGIFGSPSFIKKKMGTLFLQNHFQKYICCFTRKFPISSFAYSKENFYLFLQKYKVETAFFLNEIKTMFYFFFFFNFLFYQNNNNNFFLTKKSVSFNFVSLNTM